MLAIFARVWARSVRMPASAPVSETAFPPSAFTAMAVSAMAASSPVARSASISRSAGCGEVSRASLIRLSVTPAIAEMMATTLQPLCCVSRRRRATLRMRSGVPTEVPPYFWTISRMAKPGRSKSEGSRNGMVFAYVMPLSTLLDRAQDLLLVRRDGIQGRQAIRDHVWIFQAVAGHGANNSARLRNFREWIRGIARWVATFEKAGDGSGARGLGENSFVRGQPGLRIENFAVGDDADGAL